MFEKTNKSCATFDKVTGHYHGHNSCLSPLQQCYKGGNHEDSCFNLTCSFESHSIHHFLVHMKPVGHRLDASITTFRRAAVTQVKNKEFVLKFPLRKQHLV